MQPLARISDQDATIVEQFQLLVNGREICKAYSELVDPILQQENFDKQAEILGYQFFSIMGSYLYLSRYKSNE